MQALYYLKTPFIIFLIGQLFHFAGALFKIRHWPYGDELITAGGLFTFTAIIYAIIKIAALKKHQ
jgi:gliding motility-associated GldL-like protein